MNKEYKKTLGQKLYHALEKKYDYEIYDAKARLSVYFTRIFSIMN